MSRVKTRTMLPERLPVLVEPDFLPQSGLANVEPAGRGPVYKIHYKSGYLSLLAETEAAGGLCAL